MRILSIAALLFVIGSPSLRADDAVKVIKEMGPARFIEGILNDPVLGVLIAPQTRLDMLEKVEKLRATPPERVSVKVHRCSAFHEVFCILGTSRDQGTIILATYTVNGDKRQPIDFKWVEFPSGCHTVVKEHHAVLAPYAADKGYIDSLIQAIEKCISEKRNLPYVDLMATLAERTHNLPPYVMARVDAVMKDCGFGAKVLDGYEHRPGVRHLGSRAITDELFTSAFLLETTTVPGVLITITYLHEGKPVIMDTFVTYAMSALPSLPDESGESPRPGK